MPGASASSRSLTFLVLSPHAYGGHGGIAQYNRDLIEALSRHPACARVVHVPRHAAAPGQAFPVRVVELAGTAGKVDFMARVARAATLTGPVSMILCTHVNLLPAALLAKACARAPLCVVLYGIEVWAPTQRRAMTQVDHFVSISRFTADRFTEWSAVPDERLSIVPNAIRLDDYTPGAPARSAREAGGLVLLTLARLSAAERYKGVDEVLDVLPQLSSTVSYVVAGDGDDRPRLEQKVRGLGLSQRVRFTGLVTEAEKLDLYRLADAFVMAGRGEGFGFVYLEAMACGTPVVASVLDGSREAVRFGQLGAIVDPTDRDALARAIEAALQRPRHRPPGLEHFAFERFVARVADVVHALVREPA